MLPITYRGRLIKPYINKPQDILLKNDILEAEARLTSINVRSWVNTINYV